MAGCLQCAPYHFLGVAKTVNSRRVDPIYAEVEGAVNRGDGFTVVLRAPRELPVAAADGPSAKPNGVR